MSDRARRAATVFTLILGLVSAAGLTSAQDDEIERERSATVEYLSHVGQLLDEISEARAETLAELERVERWLAQDDIVVFGQRSGAPEVVSIAELGDAVLVATVATRLGLSRGHASLLALVDELVLDGRTVDGLYEEATPDDRRLVTERLGELVRRSGEGLERWKGELERELADYSELEGLIEAELAELSAVAPTPASTGSSVDGSTGVDVGGPFETCTWRTGWPVLDAHIPEMRIYAWTITDLGPGLGPNQFGYSVAWELDDGRGDPERMFDGQEDQLDQVIADGTGEVIFMGRASGFCSLVDSICPGYRPRPCDTVLGP